MRSRIISSLPTIGVMAASVIALVCVALPAPEPPGRIVDSGAKPEDSAPSMFIVSGGLVPDAAPPIETQDDAATHAAVTATTGMQVSTH